MFETATDIILFIGGVFVIIGGLYKAYIEFDKKRKSIRKKRDGFFAGNWSNEGNIGSDEPSHLVDLKLYCSGKEITGSITARKKSGDETWINASMNGKRSTHRSKCKITYVRHGQVLDYGTVILKKDSKRNLKWELKEGVTDFFPKETTLYRSLPVLN